MLVVMLNFIHYFFSIHCFSLLELFTFIWVPCLYVLIISSIVIRKFDAIHFNLLLWILLVIVSLLYSALFFSFLFISYLLIFYPCMYSGCLCRLIELRNNSSKVQQTSKKSGSILSKILKTYCKYYQVL